MLITSFAALYATSKVRGMKAVSTLQEARKKVRPTIYVGRKGQYDCFAPVTSHHKSLQREHIEVDLKYVPKLVRPSYLDSEEVWFLPHSILPQFVSCISYSVDKTYIDSIIFPVYLPLINGSKIN